jgi:NADH-quinone oxidoreductase subunit M
MELNLLLLLPLFGAIVLIFIPQSKLSAIRIASLLFQILTLCAGFYIFFLFQVSPPDYFSIQYDWISYFNVSYALKLDGLSFVLVATTIFLFPLVSLGSWSINPQKEKWLWVNILFLQFGLLGVFLAADIFLFYCFWEAVLIPMYFIIVLWGGEKKVKAAIEFFIYTMASSFFMLFAIFLLAIISYLQLGEISFDLQDWKNLRLGALEPYFFWAFFIPFAVKIPLFPFHAWMPGTYKNAPWIGTIFLSTILSKMGIYGLIRLLMPLFPASVQNYSFLILTFAVISILYGAAIAIMQKDLKMVIAYSSLSHLGMITLGIFSLHFLTWNGALLQIINHSVTTAAIFLILGFLGQHFQSTKIGDFYGLAKVTPKLCVCFFLFTLSAIGFPSTGSFVGELLIFLGGFQTVLWFAIFAALGVILSAVYMLRINQKIFFGKQAKDVFLTKTDLNLREILVLLPMLIVVFWIGLYPKFFFNSFEFYIQSNLNNLLLRLL